MGITRIEDGHDARLADYAGVREPALLRQRGLFIAEGRFVVRRLFDTGHVTVRSLLVNDAALNGLSDLIARMQAGCEVYVASPDVITAATGFNMHRGCLALAERPVEASLETVLATGQVVAVLERVVDPDNVGSVFRCAEAFGVDAVLLRSVLPEGDPNVIRGGPRRAIRDGRTVAGRARAASIGGVPDCRDDAG
jgi:tRNA G18 (ribose-2'-O)-methylase SpoU